MTKIKNTKKGMAKKTLSMSLVVAMLATSNVPVWAAEFSDGSDVAVATEATPAVDAQATNADAFSDDTETAPVVDNTEAVDAQAVVTSSENLTFTNVKAKTEAVDAAWTSFNGDATAAKLFDKDSAIVDSKSGDETSEINLYYVFRIGGEWDEANKAEITWNPNTSEKLAESNISISEAKLKAAAGKTLDLLFLEYDKNGKLNVVNTISYGTVQKADLQSKLTVTAPSSVIYDGTDKKSAVKPTVSGTVDGTALTADSFDWDFHSTDTNYVDAGAVITATGKLKKAIPGYTDTVTTTCKIQKRTLAADDVIVKVTTPGKTFEYQNNAETKLDKNEVQVYLKDFSKNDGSYASAVSLNDYVSKVFIDTTSIGEKTVSVVFDADALKASKNFNATAPTGITSDANKETNTTKFKVNVGALDLTKCEITLKNPAQADKNLKGTDLVLVYKKDGKAIDISNKVTVTLKTGEDYSKVGTFSNAITVAGNGTEVTGSKTLDLVTIAQAFTSNCKFEKDTTKLLSKTVNGVSSLDGRDYNNGKAVEISKDLLGKFSPDGTTYGDQDNFKITYDNNINATTNTSVAKLTVTAVAGDYKGCSQDFYFKINPATVVASATAKDNTVTTAVKKEIGGVSLNPSYTSADQYADAIGFSFTGKSSDKKITSTPSANDYKVEYSFVKADQNSKGENEVGDKIKVVVKLKKNGNFTGTTTASEVKYNNGVSATIANETDTNGVITLYVPIVEKSINSLDISLKQDTFTYTSEMIKPEVIVKEDGKVLKNVAEITGITDGVNAGTATIKIAVKGYSGTKEMKATIKPAKLSDVVFEIKKANKSDFTYTGKQLKPSIAQDATDKTPAVSESAAQADVKLGKVVVSKLFDISYGKNVDAGEKAGSVTLTPKALYAKNFDGTSITANFDILRAVLKGTKAAEVLSIKDTTGKKVSIDDINVFSGTTLINIWGEISNYNDELNWTGNVAKFASVNVNESNLAVTPNGVKFNDDDYEVVYVNAVNATSGNSKAYVAVVGKGNFKGEYSIVKYAYSDKYENYEIMSTTDAERKVKENPDRYTIVQKDVIANAAVEYNIVGGEFTAKELTYSNGTYAGGLVVKPTVSVKDSKTGATLTEGTDYKVVVYDDTATDAGSKKYEFEVIGLGKYKECRVGMKDGKILTYSIDKKDLKDCTVTVDSDLKVTVMNGNILEKKENFDVKNNGDGTATVSVVDGGKNYTGSVKVNIGNTKVGAPVISNVVVKGNTVTPVLSGEVDSAVGYDYVIATEEDYKNGRVGVSKNVLKTNTDFHYVQQGTYYAYCHAWKRNAEGKKVFGEWSNIVKFTVTATTPSTPTVTSVKVKGNTVTVTYTVSEDATGYDVVLGSAVKKVNGEKRPVDYGTLVKKNIKGNVVTATFKNVPAGKYYAGVHSFNKTSENGSKVFSKWSNSKAVTVK